MISRLLIANRGEIALRIMRAARGLGIETVAAYSDADAAAPHVRAADRAARLGPGPAAQSYLNADRVLEAARATGADAVHPGYGFLSENAAFAEAAAAAGLVFVGPSPAAIRAMGLKDEARRRAAAAGAPVIPGYDGAEQDPARLAAEAEAIGWPVMVKARAGGGGKGMRAAHGPDDFAAALAAARAEAAASFGDDAVLIEALIPSPRHIEVQVFGDAHGGLVHLYERDCSLQRRHQKVIEEAPAPGVGPEMRAALTEAALAVARSVDYVGAGTVEFIAAGRDAEGRERLSPDRFYFLEMNTRLQVEHPVTEAVTGVDLVAWQLRVAAGEPLPLRQEEIPLNGWAVEARVYAEDPARDFAPSPGRITALRLPPSPLRVDAGVAEGSEIPPYYDPMIAKVIAAAPAREGAFRRLATALDAASVVGVKTNLAFLRALLRDEAVAAGAVETGLIGARLAALTAPEEPTLAMSAVAAIAALELAPVAAGAAGAGADAHAWADPWSALIGYRAWGAARRAASLEQGETMRELAVTIEPPGAGGAARFTVERGDERLALGLRGALETGLSVEIGGVSAPASLEIAAQQQGRAITVVFEGRTERFFAPDPIKPAADAATAGGDAALAPMPGILKAVLVAVGDRVAAGQPVAQMEAMKMALTLTAPRDGIIAALEAAPGDQVPEGSAVARLESEPEAEAAADHAG